MMMMMMMNKNTNCTIDTCVNCIHVDKTENVREIERNKNTLKEQPTFSRFVSVPEDICPYRNFVSKNKKKTFKKLGDMYYIGELRSVRVFLFNSLNETMFPSPFSRAGIYYVPDVSKWQVSFFFKFDSISNNNSRGERSKLPNFNDLHLIVIQSRKKSFESIDVDSFFLNEILLQRNGQKSFQNLSRKKKQQQHNSLSQG